jgi:predicted component of type VI protein secretion system
MENWKHLIPWGLLAPFLIIILIEYGIGLGLDFYNQKLNQQIEGLEDLLKQKEESLKGGLETNEAFKTFSQTVNIIEILKNRKSLSFVIKKFNQLMPKFLIINNFTYDGEKGQIKIDAAVSNWQDYLRFHKYVTGLQVLELKDFTPPRLDEKNLIQFSMVFLLKPNFYEQ